MDKYRKDGIVIYVRDRHVSGYREVAIHLPSGSGDSTLLLHVALTEVQFLDLQLLDSEWLKVSTEDSDYSSFFGI